MEAAAAAGCSERTVRRWMDDPLFRGEVAAMQHAALDRAAAVLSANAAAAAERVTAMAVGPASIPASVRLAACRTVMDFATRLATRDILERLADLEDRIAAGGEW